MCNFLHWSCARRGTPSKVKTKRQKAGVIDEPKIVGDLGSLFMWSCTSPNKYLLSVLRPCHTTRQFVLATCNAIFAETKYCRLQLGCQTYATCFATCSEIIFYARRVFKNVSGILIMSCCDWFLLKKL